MYTIYTREACNYCDMAKAEMQRLGIKYKEVPQTQKTIYELHEKVGKSMVTYPQIFNSSDVLIGGFEDLLDYTQYEDQVNKQI